MRGHGDVAVRRGSPKVSDRTFVVWADPGLLTGLAWYDLETDAFHSGQYTPDDLRRKLDGLGQLHADRMALGYESFVHTSGGPRTSSPEHAHRAIQILSGFAKEYASVQLLKPQPSSARKLGSVVFLRRLGWHKPGRGHANDAAQHLLADLLRRQPMPAAVRGRLFPGYRTGVTIAP